MSVMYKIWASRISADANSYIGEDGKLFYNPDLQCISVSDGTTPGGSIIGAPPTYSSLPSQTGFAGNFLTTNGITSAWSPLDAGQF
jgi:hypothetical protein